MESFKTVLTATENGVLTLTMNRPQKRNALDAALNADLLAAFIAAEADDAVRAIVLTGAGKGFCAGADLATLIPLFTGARQPRDEVERKVQADPTLAMRAILRDLDLDKPVVAAVNGNAIAGGLELLYATDIRVAADTARFGLQEVCWSVFPMGGSTVRLPRQVPYARAMEILLTGELMDAATALEIGLINRVVPPARVMEEAERFARRIAANGPLAVTAVKRAVRASIGRPLKEGLAKEMELAIPVFLSEDAREGPRAFKEKRPPVFTGE